ncbi:EamA domain-containing membrane protein RarD [Cognatiyoonia koreensis]|uniref:EamA domain-containing membrane protein RarD n=1 Tax=Cognatiyoonia koreensis TaxID=364200 RepID=A0A1I0RMV8_9RHOB|nr:DMT family transporter [Cognatiyoonia koreensis]SEW41838.1 EamA domain-containing membrane protein RarD [Cognatiyoonia koreensis]
MQPLRGILFKVSSVAVFMIMASLIKATADSVPPGQAVFFRSFFAMPIILGWLAMRRELRNGWKTQKPFGHLWRGILGTIAMGLGFTGLALLPLPEVTALGYAAPLIVVIIAAVYLKEPVGVVRLSAVALGLVGVLIVISPRLSLGAKMNSTETLGVIVVLCGAMTVAMVQVLVRKLVRTESTATIVFWFTVTSTIMSLLTLPWGWVVPSWDVAALLVLAGLLGGVGQMLVTTSYRHAEASLIAPFDYTSMLLALFIGYFVFSEVPTTPMLIGASLVIAAGILVVLRERHLGLQRARQRAVTGKFGG